MITTKCIASDTYESSRSDREISKEGFEKDIFL